MSTWMDSTTVLVILLNLRLLSTSRLGACIQTVALQAVCLGVIAVVQHAGDVSVELILIVLSSVAIKAGLLPWLLFRSLRQCNVSREVVPFVGFSLSGLIGLGLLAVCFRMADRLGLSVDRSQTLLIATGLFTMVTGLFLIVSRKKAITQVLGYLVMENGIWAFGTAFALQEPMLVEMGVLLDVWVGVFVMGITINHINREFDHIDTDQLSALRD